MPVIPTELTRRRFLQTTLAVAGSLALPRVLRAKEKATSNWFLNRRTGESWSVADPVQWSLENARHPILERATAGLLNLDPGDDQRVIRLVTRRCSLNLIELHPEQVVVHHWGQLGLADVRPFFKSHELARKEVEVVLKNRKREVDTVQSGDDFLYGERLTSHFPWDAYLSKWEHRFQAELDDWAAAPKSWSGFAWEGVESNRIPWMTFKSAWRRASSPLCQNCDQPTVLVNFGYGWTGWLTRSRSFVYACQDCRRSFKDSSVEDVGLWMVENLEAEVLPEFRMIGGERVEWERGTDA